VKARVMENYPRKLSHEAGTGGAGRTLVFDLVHLSRERQKK